MTLELVVYIHGVSPRGQKSHDADYKTLHSGIRKTCPGFPEAFCGVEWGWNDGSANPRSHQLLNDAEEALGRRALDAVSDPSDFTLNPMRLAIEKFRPLMIHNFSDMFYYASEDGKSAVRYVVARKILDCLPADVSTNPAHQVSLTLLGHSAGSVAAFDFLFFLFGPERPTSAFIHPEKVKAAPSGEAAGATNVADTLGELEGLRDLAQTDKLRIRRLFTFGSPITPLAFRSDAVVGILARPANNRLDCADYGLTRNPGSFNDPLANPRWINIWDKDDPIAWPVEPLMTVADRVVRDRYVDVSDSPLSAHHAYWSSGDVHREIGKAW